MTTIPAIQPHPITTMGEVYLTEVELLMRERNVSRGEATRIVNREAPALRIGYLTDPPPHSSEPSMMQTRVRFMTVPSRLRDRALSPGERIHPWEQAAEDLRTRENLSTSQAILIAARDFPKLHEEWKADNGRRYTPFVEWRTQRRAIEADILSRTDAALASSELPPDVARVIKGVAREYTGHPMAAAIRRVNGQPPEHHTQAELLKELRGCLSTMKGGEKLLRKLKAIGEDAAARMRPIDEKYRGLRNPKLPPAEVPTAAAAQGSSAESSRRWKAVDAAKAIADRGIVVDPKTVVYAIHNKTNARYDFNYSDAELAKLLESKSATTLREALRNVLRGILQSPEPRDMGERVQWAIDVKDHALKKALELAATRQRRSPD